MQPLRILVAEDDEQNQAIMKMLLTRHGHSVTSAWNGKMAIALALTNHYDLIFMDMQMPEMGGIEAIKHIRQSENKQKHTFIVVMTGSVPESVSTDYKTAGADTYISKPFDPHRIIFLLNIVQESQASSSILENQSDLNINPEKETLLDIEGSLPRFNNEPKFYIDNLNEFLYSLPERLAKIESAIRQDDWEAVTAIAHNLKGVAANIGAVQISMYASILDEQSKYKLEKQAGLTYNNIKTSIEQLNNFVNSIEISQLLPSELMRGH